MGLRRQVRQALADAAADHRVLAMKLDRLADRQQPEQHRGQRSIDAAINQLRARRVVAFLRGEDALVVELGLDAESGMRRALASYTRSQARQRELARGGN